MNTSRSKVGAQEFLSTQVVLIISLETHHPKLVIVGMIHLHKKKRVKQRRRRRTRQQRKEGKVRHSDLANGRRRRFGQRGSGGGDRRG
jgi:hypothetical protein